VRCGGRLAPDSNLRAWLFRILRNCLIDQARRKKIDEAVGDHLRIVAAPRPLDVESNDVHNVKPWFTGRIDFVPPLSFVGDDEFRLRGGALAVFQGHKAAAFVYQRRLHTITLLVYPDAAGAPRDEATRRGFHVIRWTAGGMGLALVSDISWYDLRQLEARLR
jgi:anti-sigma factor RsiW